MNSVDFFRENNYLVVNKFINTDVCTLLYHYCQLEATRLKYLEENWKINDLNEDETLLNMRGLFGEFNDPQVPGSFAKYGDLIFDTVLNLSLQKMEELTGLQLIPTYNYHRVYFSGNDLKKHIDRESCEISTTLTLGYDNTNLNYNYCWPIYLKNKQGVETKVELNPGDMLIYRGCELQHWREPLEGNHHAQVFLHYNEKNGKHDNMYDGRATLGLPNTFRGTKNDIE